MNGVPLANAYMYADTANHYYTSGVGDTRTDASGHFQFQVPHTTMDLTASLAGFTQQEIPLVNTTGSSTSVVQDIVLHQNDATVSGTVTDGASGAAPTDDTGVDVFTISPDPAGNGAYAGSVSNARVAGDGTYRLSTASGNYQSVVATSANGTIARSDTEVAPYTVYQGDNPPISFVLPTLAIEGPTSGCSTAQCTLSISGSGWAVADTIHVTLLECVDNNCSSGTNFDLGSIQADADGQFAVQSLQFDAPAAGSYWIEANDGTPDMPHKDLRTLSPVYQVTTH
ncbi:MAG: carboxypeptidase regulatory-like domain-containing protein [Chloroflexi bacterium]|nr:carboxypeptidase regulatory-like domain-containing protein [Chloroflexota bacterium]